MKDIKTNVPYLDEKLQKHIDQMNLDSFILHLDALCRLHPDKNGIYFEDKDWPYKTWYDNMLCINFYLQKLEMMHTLQKLQPQEFGLTHINSVKFDEENKNIEALIKGLQFFVGNLLIYKNLPILSVIIETFKYCLETIESKINGGQINSISLSSCHCKFINYLNHVPELQKKLDEVKAQISSEEKSSGSHERLQSLKDQRSNIIKLLYPITFDPVRKRSINLPSLTQSESVQSFENNTPPDSPLFFF